MGIMLIANVEIMGHSLFEQPIKAKQEIGVVPEQANVYGDLTAWEILMFIGEIYLMKKNEAAKRAAEKSYEEAAFLYTSARNKGFTIRSTVDVIIAQIAIENHLYLLHQDRDFSRLAGIEHRLKEF